MARGCDTTGLPAYTLSSRPSMGARSLANCLPIVGRDRPGMGCGQDGWLHIGGIRSCMETWSCRRGLQAFGH